ncbi:MAG: universal stress protein [Commensalibacter sp.]|nr:universal stress protein [Commensalibacter sp.]
MSVMKKILIPIQGTPYSEITMNTAYQLAEGLGAHLSVLHIYPDTRDVIPLTGEGLSGSMIEEVMNAAEQENLRRIRHVRQIYDQFVGKWNIIPTAFRADEMVDGKTTASFTTLMGRESNLISYWARLSDITIISHPDSGEEISSSEALHTILFDSGCPVVIAPKESPKTAGKRVCIAWNGSAESAAALHASLSWTTRADAVTILYTPDYEKQGMEIKDVIEYLRFHKVKAVAQEFNPGRDTGASMLDICNKLNADMLCMGAYSHPRWQQLILGGVTRYMLENANIPVLMNR